LHPAFVKTGKLNAVKKAAQSNGAGGSWHRALGGRRPALHCLRDRKSKASRKDAPPEMSASPATWDDGNAWVGPNQAGSKAVPATCPTPFGTAKPIPRPPFQHTKQIRFQNPP